MKLLIVLITHNRLEYTKRTYKSLLDTITIPHYLVIVDNASTDGSVEWIGQEAVEARRIFNEENYYPGKACNIGWAVGLEEYPEATHLMRCDNDMEFKPGWDKVATEYFEKIPELGQLGLDHEAIETPESEGKKIKINGLELNMWPGCVGGPCIISRDVWDKGIRYDETPWHPVGVGEPGKPPMQEDSRFTQAIIQRGFYFGHIQQEVARTFANRSNWKDYPDYYLKTMEERGYTDNAAYIRSLK